MDPKLRRQIKDLIDEFDKEKARNEWHLEMARTSRLKMIDILEELRGLEKLDLW